MATVVYLHTTPLYASAHHHPKRSKFAADTWVAFKQLNTLENGGVTVEGFNDLILSVQPDGTWEFKSHDEEPGQYEIGTLNGSTIVFNPSGTLDPWVYPCVTTAV